MAAIKPRKLADILANKLHFEEIGGKHRRFVLNLDGRPRAMTHISHTIKTDLSDALLHLIARQMMVGRGDLVDLVACTKDADWYYDRLREVR